MPYPKGKPSWNRGLTKETDERVARQAEKLRGRERSKEHRQNLSRALMGKFVGELNPMYEKRHTKETKKKISEKARLRIGSKNPFYGRHHTEETKQKIGIASRGRCAGEKHYLYGKHLPVSTRTKMSEAKRIFNLSKDQLKNLYWRDGLSSVEIGNRYGFSNRTVRLWMAKYNIPRRNKSEAQKGKRNYMYGKKRPDFADRYGKRDEFERKKYRALVLKPTKIETRLIQIIKEHHLPFRYCGDGSVVILGKNPDFISTDGKKKIIEVFGEVFHDPYEAWFDVDWERTELGRKIIFSQVGYDTLIIWGEELENEPEIVDKITNFIGSKK